jgi:outer membrane biosynthesis protein TonB
MLPFTRSSALLALLLFAGTAVAQTDQDVERAKALFREGYELAVEEKWAEALEKLEASRSLIERPSTVFNIGTTLLRLGRAKDAVAAFERFLEIAATEDPAREEALSLLAEAKQTVKAEEPPPVPPEPPPMAEPIEAPPPKPIEAAPEPRITAVERVPPEDEDDFVGGTVFWVIVGAGVVAVIGGAIAVGLAARPGEEEPYPGTLNSVLEGLRAR